MNLPQIKNVVFDIGNVLVRWSPIEIIRLTFGESDDSQTRAKTIFQSPLWLAINRGELNKAESRNQFQQQFGFTPETVEQLFYYVKHTQLTLFGSVDLVKRVKAAGYRTFALTDNVGEIVEHLKQRHDFWPLFEGAIVSAEVKCLKPSAEIFNHLLEKYELKAEECVFIDDVLVNVEGAKKLGFSTIQFKNAQQCEQDLKALGLHF